MVRRLHMLRCAPGNERSFLRQDDGVGWLREMSIMAITERFLHTGRNDAWGESK